MWKYEDKDFNVYFLNSCLSFPHTLIKSIIGRPHRYLIEVDCSLCHFKPAKLMDKEYTINAPSFSKTLQKKKEIDATNF